MAFIIEEANGRQQFDNKREYDSPNKGRVEHLAPLESVFSAPLVGPIADTVSVGPMPTVVEAETRPFALPCEIYAEQWLSRIDDDFIDGGVLAAND